MGIPAGKRREEIRRLLLESGDRVLSAGELAARFDVSRQIIVGDIAILRAGGEEILSTARGYRLARPAAEPPKSRWVLSMWARPGAMRSMWQSCCWATGTGRASASAPPTGRWIMPGGWRWGCPCPARIN